MFFSIFLVDISGFTFETTRSNYAPTVSDKLMISWRFVGGYHTFFLLGDKALTKK